MSRPRVCPLTLPWALEPAGGGRWVRRLGRRTPSAPARPVAPQERKKTELSKSHSGPSEPTLGGVAGPGGASERHPHEGRRAACRGGPSPLPAPGANASPFDSAARSAGMPPPPCGKGRGHRTDRTGRTSRTSRTDRPQSSYRSYPPPEQAPSSGMPSALMAAAVEAGSSCQAPAWQMPAHAPPRR
jgi:hypothetical protein